MMKATDKEREYARGYYLRNKKRINAYSKWYHETYPEVNESCKIRRAMKRMPKDTYTLTEEQKHTRSRIVQELRMQGEDDMADRLNNQQ